METIMMVYIYIGLGFRRNGNGNNYNGLFRDYPTQYIGTRGSPLLVVKGLRSRVEAFCRV